MRSDYSETRLPRMQAPVVKATRSPRGLSLVVERCPFCGERHWHGATGPNIGDGDGPRYSHCIDVAPSTYVVREVKGSRAADRETNR